MTILVCGEALMDVFAVADTATGVTLDARFGGSPFNVAVGLARLRQPVALFAALSSGFLGERLRRALVAEGVDVAAVPTVDAPTTLGLVGLDAAGVPSYAFYGHGGADRRLHPGALASLPAGIAAIQLGSFATVVEPIASTLRELVRRARPEGKALIAYDPNVRLNVEPDLARWRGALDWMLARADLVKISEEDLALLRPGETARAFAAAAIDAGVRLAVVTRGAAGASAWTKGVEADAAAPQVDVVDTVGAGDSFQAALLAWLAERQALSAPALEALSAASLAAGLGFAARAAALTCSRRGADLPRREELE